MIEFHRQIRLQLYLLKNPEKSSFLITTRPRRLIIYTEKLLIEMCAITALLLTEPFCIRQIVS
jgi:hypothetical protein